MLPGRLGLAFAGLLIVALDQGSKAWVEEVLPLGARVDVFPFFAWVHVQNTGAAFSMFADESGWQRWFFVLLAIAFGAWLLWELARLGREDDWQAWAYATILGGALGNLVDRVENRGGDGLPAVPLVRPRLLPGLQRGRRGHYHRGHDLDRTRRAGDRRPWSARQGRGGRPGEATEPHMTERSLPVGPGTRVTLHFALLSESGDEIDSTFQRKPATFDVGDGNLLPGFEEAMFGLTAGETASLEVPPERAFGQRNPENIQRMPRHVFAPDMALEEGLVVSFADAANSELPGVVAEFDDEEVVVDFNHPLAGQALRFDVNVIRVEAAVLQ